MVSNPCLTDTLGISTQLWNGSNGLLFSFPASSSDFTRLTFWHILLLKTFCRDASWKKKKTTNQPTSLSWRDIVRSGCWIVDACQVMGWWGKENDVDLFCAVRNSNQIWSLSFEYIKAKSSWKFPSTSVFINLKAHQSLEDAVSLECCGCGQDYFQHAFGSELLIVAFLIAGLHGFMVDWC